MSKPAAPRKLADLLARKSARLGQVLERANRLEALTEQVRASLPTPEADHIVAVAITGETLVVTVDSAPWAARLRFAESDLIRAAGDAARGKRLVVRVRPAAGD